MMNNIANLNSKINDLNVQNLEYEQEIKILRKKLNDYEIREDKTYEIIEKIEKDKFTSEKVYQKIIAPNS